MQAAFSQGRHVAYLGDRLRRPDVGVWSQQNVLQLRLLLIDALHGEALVAAAPTLLGCSPKYKKSTSVNKRLMGPDAQLRLVLYSYFLYFTIR